MTIRNTKPDQIVTKSGIIVISTSASDGTGSVLNQQLRFAKSLKYVIDDSEVQRDRIDDATPVFTRLGDVLGTFEFNFKDTIDMYDAINPSSDTSTLSYWLEQIAALNYPLITFVHQKEAPNSAGNKFARPTFSGRLMKVNMLKDITLAIEEATIEGEITAFTSAIRAAS